MTQPQIKEVIRLYTEEFESPSFICNLLGVSRKTILQILELHEISHSQMSKEGKLAFSKKDEIIEKYLSTDLCHSKTSLGREYNVGKHIIAEILKVNGIESKFGANRKWTLNHNAFSVIENEEQAYWLGWMYSDGCNNQSRGNIALSLQEKDKLILEQFSSFLGSNKPLEYCSPRTERHSAMYRLGVSSPFLCSDLTKWGCGQAKTFEITFPEWMRRDLVRHFLRGVLDGDGCVTGNTCSIIGTRNLMIGINEFLSQELNIQGRADVKHPENNDIIVAWRLESRYKTLRFLKWLYDGAEFKLERKYQKYLDILDRTPLMSELIYDDGTHFSKQDKLKRRYFKRDVRNGLGATPIPTPVYEKPHSLPHLQYAEMIALEEEFKIKKQSNLLAKETAATPSQDLIPEAPPYSPENLPNSPHD